MAKTKTFALPASMIPSNVFDLRKATHVASYFIWKEQGIVDKLKLIKLMYLAEKSFILQYGERLTGDRLESNELGPMLFHSYSLCDFRKGASYWDQWIAQVPKSHLLSLKKKDLIDSANPLHVLNSLSRAEQKVLEDVYSQYGNYSPADLIKVTQDRYVCPEWKKSFDQPFPISIHDLLQLNNVSEERIKAILKNVKERDSALAFWN